MGITLTANFPSGQTHQTVHGLHQWDYGLKLTVQGLAIKYGVSPENVELHFEYPGISEAIVRSSEVTDDTATVTIPDVCLEQPAPLTVWVCMTGETYGRTIRTITMPIIARARPAVRRDA